MAAPAAGPALPQRIAVLGPWSAGKTSLCRRLNREAFAVHEQPTIMLDFYAFANVRLASGASVGLEIYDTAGQERFAAVIGMTLRSIDGALVVYALDDARSLAAAQDYVARVRGHDAGVPIVLVGNKLDLVDAEACVAAYEREHGSPEPAAPANSAGPWPAGACATDLAANWVAPPQASSASLPQPVTLNVAAAPANYAEAAAALYGAWRSDYNTDTNSYLSSSDDDDDATLGVPSTAATASDGEPEDGGAGSSQRGGAAVCGVAPDVAPWAARRRVRAIARDDVCAYAQRNALAYVETSALANTCVVGAFMLLAERVAARRHASAPAWRGTDCVALTAARQNATTDATLAEIERALAPPAPPPSSCAC